MSLDIFWFLPTTGDTRYLGTSDLARAPTLDPWVTAASLDEALNGRLLLNVVPGGEATEPAAKHVDAYLTWGEPPAAVAEKIADVRAPPNKRTPKLRCPPRGRTPPWGGLAAAVAARLQEYIDLGVERFVLSAYPHLEESIPFAELVFPLLPGKKPVTLQSQSQTGKVFDNRAGTAVAAPAGPVYA